MALYDTVTFDDPDTLELDEFEREWTSNEDRKYLQSYLSGRTTSEPDYDYDRDDYPYGPNND